MNVTYKIEKNTESIICYCIAVLVLVFGVGLSSHLPFSWDIRGDLPCVFSVEWFASILKYLIVTMFLIWCGRILGRKNYDFKKWVRNIKKCGNRTSGRVIKVVKERLIMSSNSDKENIRFNIEYISEIDGKEHVFTTPVLNFIPIEDMDYICDVYELSNRKQIDICDEMGGLLNIDDNSITFNVNPLKLFRVVRRSSVDDYGNVYADNFKKVF